MNGSARPEPSTVAK
jgi:hypothetical protein